MKWQQKYSVLFFAIGMINIVPITISIETGRIYWYSISGVTALAICWICGVILFYRSKYE